MPNEMIERAAAVIIGDRYGDTRYPPLTWAEMSPAERRAGARLARAVIASLREPSEAVAREGAAHVCGPNPDRSEIDETSAQWTSMIDHILTEEGETR